MHINKQWLDLSSVEGQSIWTEAWSRSLARRPHDHLAYILFMMQPGDRASGIIFAQNGGRILYPFYERKLNDISTFKEFPLSVTHLVSPYGYGGPIYEGNEAKRAEIEYAFETWFRHMARERGVVSEFVREDIFQGRIAKRTFGEKIIQQSNVVVRLGFSEEEHWRNYKQKVRKNVTRARSEGLRVSIDETGEQLADFIRVYHDTMKRTGASSEFFIEFERFAELGRALGAEKSLAYAHVFDNEKIVSTELLLLSSDTIYSFLGGTILDSFEKRPNDLLKHEVILWGNRKKFKYYALGGGVVAGDGIFKYKESFDPGGVLPFFTRKMIHSSELYDSLVDYRNKYEISNATIWIPREDFFPRYLA